jgi:hypothetical protein
MTRELPPPPDELEALYAEARGIPPLDARVSGRLRARVEDAVLMQTALGAGTTILTWKAAIGLSCASFALGAVTGGAWIATTARGANEAAPIEAAPTSHEPDAVVAPDVPDASVDAPPSPVSIEGREAPTVIEQSARSTTEDSLRQEQRLLDAARVAFSGGDASHALEVLERHRRRFPSGILAEDREALGIEALVGAGRPDEAIRRGEVFVREHPESMYVQRVLRGIARAREDRHEPALPNDETTGTSTSDPEAGVR